MSAPQPEANEDTEVRKNATQVFLDAAKRAKKRGDTADLERRLQAWATLAPIDPPLPTGLEAEAAESLAWAKEHGRFRIFASRLEDRVSVGVEDPAHLVARVDAWIRDGDKQLQLVRVDSERADRWEYRLGLDRSSVAIVVIDAISTQTGKDLAIARAVFLPENDAPPVAPDPAKLAGVKPARTQEEIIAPERGLKWWWIVGGAIAVGFAGAAVWQETRF